jgi:hypothetical protein
MRFASGGSQRGFLLVERAKLTFAAARWDAECSMVSIDLSLMVFSTVRCSMGCQMQEI